MRQLAQAMAFLFAFVGGCWCLICVISMGFALYEGETWNTAAVGILMLLPGVLLVLAGFWFQRSLKRIESPRGFEPVMKPTRSAAAPSPDVNTGDHDATTGND
ncbi:MAG TPA: hypothetical protein VIL86_16345 [Tepidisphaeraceae bacterium]|jgi:hypothetical protein